MLGSYGSENKVEQVFCNEERTNSGENSTGLGKALKSKLVKIAFKVYLGQLVRFVL